MAMYANKTTTLAIVAIVTAIALVASGSITASAVAVRSKHSSIKSDSLTTTRGTGGLPSKVINTLLSCLSSLKGADNKATPLAAVGNQGTPLRGAITDCVNSALGLSFGSSPSREAVSTSSNSDLVPSTSMPSTSMMTGQ